MLLNKISGGTSFSGESIPPKEELITIGTRLAKVVNIATKFLTERDARQFAALNSICSSATWEISTTFYKSCHVVRGKPTLRF